MHSQKIRTFSSCLLRGGTDLTGLSWSTPREYPRLISMLILVSFLWDRESLFLQMGNHGDTEWLDRSSTGNLWWEKKRESDRSSTVPHLSPKLSPVPGPPAWGCQAGGSESPCLCSWFCRHSTDFPLLFSVSQGWALRSPCSAARAAHPPTSSHQKTSLEWEAGAGEGAQENQAQPPAGPAQSLDLHLGSLIVGYQQW